MTSRFFSRDICDLAERYNAMVFVDECHATGFFGKTGRYTAWSSFVTTCLGYLSQSNNTYNFLKKKKGKRKSCSDKDCFCEAPIVDLFWGLHGIEPQIFAGALRSTLAYRGASISSTPHSARLWEVLLVSLNLSCAIISLYPLFSWNILDFYAARLLLCLAQRQNLAFLTSRSMAVWIHVIQAFCRGARQCYAREWQAVGKKTNIAICLLTWNILWLVALDFVKPHFVMWQTYAPIQFLC